jgi:hypothetical protein
MKLVFLIIIPYLLVFWNGLFGPRTERKAP